MSTKAPTTNKTAQDLEACSLAKDAAQPFEDLLEYGRKYAKEKPEMAALWCLGIGFVLGWKMKPW